VSAYREWRERVAKALGKPPLPPEVREAQRVYEQDVVQFWDDRKAGDQAAIDRNKLYESELTAAECRAGIHDGCVHEEAHDDTEYMHARSGSGEQVGVVWGTVNPDGSVTARGFTDSENYRDDSDVHPAGSLVAYHAEDNTWVHMATGQTVERQREIDTARAEEPPVNQAAKGVVDGVSTVTPTGLATAVASSATGKDIKSPMASAVGSTTSSGGAMASIEEVRAGVDIAKEKASESLGALQQAESNLGEAQAQMMQVTEGSGQAAAADANAALAQAVTAVTEVSQQVQVAIEASEQFAGQL
jgi:hypothetical protein